MGRIVSAHAATNFFEGFETGLTNWVVGDGNSDGTPAYWGIVGSAFGSEGTHSGSAKAYCAAIGYAGTSTAPAYENSMSAYLTRTVDLSGQTNATLSFWYKTPGIETEFDAARVLVGNTELWFTDLAQTNWTLVELSLEAFIGTTQTLTFDFTSDDSFTREGWYLDDILLTDSAAPAPPPANDAFAAAHVLAGSLGSIGAVNRGASSEANEPDPGNSIWFRWTAYTNGPVTFRTGGSTFDTLLCLYTGNSLASLVRVGCDDNGDTNNASLITFSAAAGSVYSISIRGGVGASGFALLSWEQTNGLGADLLPDLFVWTNAPAGYLYGWYIDQNEPTQPGRTLMRVSTATPNIGAGPLQLRGSSTEPGVYQRIFRADGSFHDRFAGNFTFHPGHGHLHFDNWMNLHLRTVLTNGDVGDIVASGDKTSFAIIDLAPYDGSLPGAPGSRYYEGGLVQGLSVGWADVYSAGLPDQWIDVTDVPSGRYWLEAIVDPANSILESNESNNVARLLINFVQPTDALINDNFSNAIPIITITGGDVGSNVGASRETNEPTHLPGVPSTRSVWWRWTAPSNMNVTISTDGSSFDTVLAVYAGTSVNNLVAIASDDDSGVGANSLVTFAATAGVTYRIAVDGYESATGYIQLHVNPAWNNQFNAGLVITGAMGTVSGSTRGATRETGEPLHHGVNGAGSIWYSWTAPFTRPFTFDTEGSSFDTLLGIYTGTEVTALTTIASDDNSGSYGTSRVVFDAISNTTYRIAVDGVGDYGVVKLAWSGPAPPSLAAQPLSTNAPAGAIVTFRVGALGSAPLAFQWRHEGTNLADSEYISGATTATLTLNKVLFAHEGVYTLVITNAYGAVTSAPANLIVLDNPRVVFVEETFGHSGAFVRVPIEMQSLGNEHAVSFTLLFDPAVLSNPRATNIPASAILTLNTNQLASGALGVGLTLPGLAAFAAGHVGVVDFIFDTAHATGHTETFAGLGASPVVRGVTGTNGLALTTLFVAGVIALEPLRLEHGTFSNGTYRLTFSATAASHYAIDASDDLVTWTPLSTNAPAAGLFEFADSAGSTRRFYRVRLLP